MQWCSWNAPAGQALSQGELETYPTDERYSAGVFKTYAEALEKAKQLVDKSLLDLLEPGKSADDLMASYVMFGEDPFIRPTPEGIKRFSARDYARQRVAEIV